eukprot:283396-Chlamydomonas_euryale.AAC.9
MFQAHGPASRSLDGHTDRWMDASQQERGQTHGQTDGRTAVSLNGSGQQQHAPKERPEDLVRVKLLSRGVEVRCRGRKRRRLPRASHVRLLLLLLRAAPRCCL